MTINTKIGQGLDVNGKVLGVEADAGFKIYYPNNFIGNPVQTIELNANIEITNKIFIGFEAQGSKDPTTGQPIPGSQSAFLGIKIGTFKLGFGDLPNSGDVTAKTGVGIWTPFGGGEVEANANLSEFYKRASDAADASRGTGPAVPQPGPTPPPTPKPKK